MIIKRTLRNIINAIRFRCLNLQYAKSFHPNVMKFTVVAKHDLRVLFMKFLSNQSNLLIQYNFILDSYLGFARPSLGVQ